MKEQLSRLSGWIARPVAILALLVGVGAIGAALALAIEGGGGDASTRFELVAERSDEASGEEDHKGGDSDGRGHGFGGGFDGLPEGFEGLPEDLEGFREELESFRGCLEEEGVEPLRGFGFGHGFGDEAGAQFRDRPQPGFFGRFDGSGIALEQAHFRRDGGPGFGRGGGDFDFDALQQALEACSDQLPEGLQEPFNNRQERFDQRQEHRSSFEDCLREQGVGAEDRPGPGQLPDEADVERLRGAFEQCRDQLGGRFGGPEGNSGDQPQEG